MNIVELKIETCIGEPPIKIDIESIGSYNRHYSEIKEMLNSYLYKFDSKQNRDEIKEKILKILNNDIRNIRKEKLKKLDEISGNNKIKYNSNNILLKIEIQKII